MDKKEFSLFRYRPPDCEQIDALNRNEIWASRPKVFNDPSDSTFFVTMVEIRKHMRDLINRTHSMYESGVDNEIFCNSFVEDMVSKIKNEPLIACFSEKVNNPAMWAHYAKNAEGFAIEYSYVDLEKLANIFLKKSEEEFLNNNQYLRKSFNNRKYPLHVRKVNYAEEKFDATKIITNLLDEYSSNNYYIQDKSQEELLTSFVYLTFCTKKEIWSYEKEWRMVLNTYGETKEKKRKMHFNIQNNIFQIFPKAIYLGELAGEETRKKICKYCHRNQIKLYEMSSDIFEKKFELKYKEINDNSMLDVIKKAKKTV